MAARWEWLVQERLGLELWRAYDAAADGQLTQAQAAGLPSVDLAGAGQVCVRASQEKGGRKKEENVVITKRPTRR